MTHRINAERPAGYRPQSPMFARANNRSFDIHADGDTAEISIYDEIGYWGITAADLRARLDGISAANIVVNINSPGGDVFDGIAMFNDLKHHRSDVTVNVTGLAASAASLIAMAGDTITIAANAALMIHNAWGRAAGNKTVMQDYATVLGQVDASLAATYADRTEMQESDVAALMDAETWFTGQAAIDAGFADELLGGVEATAQFDLSIYAHAPDHLRLWPDAQPQVKTKRDLEATLRDAGFSRKDAKETIARALASSSPQRDVVGPSELAALQRCAKTLRG